MYFSLFADDCLLYRKIETDNDHRVLQQDLEMWARKWLMTFNQMCNSANIT